MIGFITNALVITTQRHLSYYQGKEDHHKVQRMFANSIILHLLISLILCIVFLCLMDYLCMDYLNIEESRRETAKFVYLMSVCILFITFMSAPFKALFIAHENIIYISVVEVIDGILKLILALTLLHLDFDKLKVYACIMMFIVLFQLIWGIGLDRETALKGSVEQWQGENLLGCALMEVRDWLKEVKNEE